MKKLYLYIVKSFIGPFALTFLISIFILLMQFLWRYLDELVGKGLENKIIIELIWYATMSLIPMAFTLAVLLASIMTFGNFGERYELLAIKASGISLFKIMSPLIIFIFIITVSAFFLSDQVIPVTNAKFYALLHSVKKQRPEMIVKEGVFSNEMDGYSIKVNDRNPKTKALLGILIYDHTERRGNVNVTVADSCYLNMSDDKQYMILNLFHGENYSDEKTDSKSKNKYPFSREKFEQQKVFINVKNFALERTSEKAYQSYYRMLKNKELEGVIDSLQSRYNEKEQHVATEMKYNKLLNAQIFNNYFPESYNVDSLGAVSFSKPFDSLFSAVENKNSVLNTALQIAQQNQRTILKYKNDIYNQMIWINKYITEWHKKYTMAVACLLFFFIGAPLGAIIRKGGFGMPVVVSILLFISYYLMSVIGEKIAREGVWEINMVLWGPTVFYFIVGIILTYQAVTDSLLLNNETYKRLIRSFNILHYLKPNNR